MKRLILVALLAVAACAQKSPEEAKAGSAASDVVVLAHFVAEADPGNGTIRFTVEPTPLGKAMGTSLVIPDTTGAVMHSNLGWVNSAAGSYCGATMTWGAQVWVTSAYADPSYIGGIYAQITDFTDGGGGTPCNGLSDTAGPVGVDATKGLWSQGTAGVGADSSTTPWAFNYVSATPFKFYGRVLGVKLSSYAVAAGSGPIGAIKANGSTMVFPTNDGMGFLTSTGTVSGVALDVGAATQVAPDVANSRIWFVSSAYAGFTNGTGGGQTYVNWQGNVGNFYSGYGIVRDGIDANTAWVLAWNTNAGQLAYAFQKVIVSGGTARLSGSAVYQSGKLPIDIVALGSKLYVTESLSTTTGMTSIAAWDTATYDPSGTMTVAYYTPSGNCAGSYTATRLGGNIIVGPDGDLWYTGSNALCYIAAAGGSGGTRLDPLPDNASPWNLCIGSDGNAWYLRAAGVVRFVAGKGSPWVADVTGSTFQRESSCASGSAGFWAFKGTNTNNFLKIEP